MSELTCWCKQSDLAPFNGDYFRCQSCETLVCCSQPESAAAFYGRDYWTTRQTNVLGHPDIYHRARLDLSERAVYWLRTLLKYKRPPGRTLELGSGHGGFSALLQWTGFKAMGLEPHAWVSQLSDSIFNVPILTGRLADQSLQPQSLDVIIMLDVLEHLPDPVETLHLCYVLLKPDGLLMIQTPCVPQDMTPAEMESAENPFLKMLLPLEHLYLYSEKGIRQQLAQTGFGQVVFEEPLFPYDMFLVAAGSAVPSEIEADPAEALMERSSSRLVLALIDLYEKWQGAEERAQANSIQRETAEVDRQALLEQIGELSVRLEESEADRLARKLQIDLTSRRLAEVDQDRQARLEQVETLEGWLRTAEDERAALQKQVEQLTGWLKTAEADRANRLEQVGSLTNLLEEAETDRQARLVQVNELAERLETAETERQKLVNQVKELTQLLQESEADRTARLDQINELNGLLAESEVDRAARLEKIQELTWLLNESEADRAARLEQIQSLTATIHQLQDQGGDEEPDSTS
jgi:SAM-dependent methyltransferase